MVITEKVERSFMLILNLALLTVFINQFFYLIMFRMLFVKIEFYFVDKISLIIHMNDAFFVYDAVLRFKPVAISLDCPHFTPSFHLSFPWNPQFGG